MIITDELKTTISLACDEAGSQTKFAKKTGVKQATINRYINGQIKEITPPTLAKLWPHIYKFMPKDCGFDSEFASETNAEILSQSNEYQNKYAMFKLMHTGLNDIGADSLFFHLMTFWLGFDDKQKKEAYKQISLVASGLKIDAITEIDSTENHIKKQPGD